MSSDVTFFELVNKYILVAEIEQGVSAFETDQSKSVFALRIIIRLFFFFFPESAMRLITKLSNCDLL